MLLVEKLVSEVPTYQSKTQSFKCLSELHANVAGKFVAVDMNARVNTRQIAKSSNATILDDHAKWTCPIYIQQLQIHTKKITRY